MSRVVELICNVDIEQSFESFHAHAIPDGAEIQPGDVVLVHGVPTDIGFGETFTGQCRATLTRAGFFARFWTRMAGVFAVAELYEVGFQPAEVKG